MLFGSSKLHEDVVKVNFPEVGASALEIYLLKEDGDYELSLYSLILHQIESMPTSNIFKIEDVTNIEDEI